VTRPELLFYGTTKPNHAVHSTASTPGFRTSWFLLAQEAAVSDLGR